MVINHCPVHHSGLVVPVFDPKHIAIDTVIERTGRNLDFLLCAPDVVPQGENLIICYRNKIVGNEEGTYADNERSYRQGDEDSFERYSSRLDGKELVVLCERTYRHHRGEQGSQREGKRKQCCASPTEKLQYNLETETFADKFIDI